MEVHLMKKINKWRKKAGENLRTAHTEHCFSVWTVLMKDLSEHMQVFHTEEKKTKNIVTLF